MAREKHPPITLLETDDQRIELVQVKGGVALRAVGDDGDVEVGVEGPTLTAAEWCQVGIELVRQCPSARDILGLVTTEFTEPFTVTGRTLGKRRAWQAWLTEIGDDYDGRLLLEWSSSRPLAEYEVGAVFKALIGPLGKLESHEKGEEY